MGPEQWASDARYSNEPPDANYPPARYPPDSNRLDAPRFPPGPIDATRFPPDVARYPQGGPEGVRFPPDAGRFPPGPAEAQRYPPGGAEGARFPPEGGPRYGGEGGGYPYGGYGDAGNENRLFYNSGMLCVLGMPPRNVGIAKQYAVEGVITWVLGTDELDRQMIAIGQRMSQLFQIAQIGENILHEDLAEGKRKRAIDMLLIEVLAFEPDFTDSHFEYIAPERDTWNYAVAELTRRLVSFCLGCLKKSPQFGDRKPRFHLPDLHQYVLQPFVRELVYNLQAVVESRKRKADEDGVPFVYREPTREELDQVKAVPQCSVRGVGWNSSTKAWVSSWLPIQGHKRACATFSCRKYGFHGAMKLAIAQRLRSELRIYGFRRFPLNQYVSKTDIEATAEQSTDAGTPSPPPRLSQTAMPQLDHMGGKRKRGRPRKAPSQESGSDLL